MIYSRGGGGEGGGEVYNGNIENIVNNSTFVFMKNKKTCMCDSLLFSML